MPIEIPVGEGLRVKGACLPPDWHCKCYITGGARPLCGRRPRGVAWREGGLDDETLKARTPNP